VLLTADAALDLRANPDMEAQGVAIEAHLDRGRGPVATVLIQRGTLRVGDSIVAGDAYGRVRRMVDEHGEDVAEALPSRPVQVIGFTSVPGAGDNLLVVDEDRIARQIADRRSARKRNALAARTRKRVSLDDLDAALKETSQLNLILKGDNSGTVEALEEALLGIEIDDITEEVERLPLEQTVDTVMGQFEKGTQGAFWLKVIGKSGGRERIVIDHITRIHPSCAPDWPQPDEGVGDHRVVVDGDPRLTILSRADVPGGTRADGGNTTAANRLLGALNWLADQKPRIYDGLDVPMQSALPPEVEATRWAD